MSLLTQFLPGVPVVQRGVTTSAGTVTISAVDMTTATVISVSKGSAGSVAVSSGGSISLTATDQSLYGFTGGTSTAYTFAKAGNIQLNGSISTGGTTNITSRGYNAELTSSTTLVCDGPVEWQVISY